MIVYYYNYHKQLPCWFRFVLAEDCFEGIAPGIG